MSEAQDRAWAELSPLYLLRGAGCRGHQHSAGNGGRPGRGLRAPRAADRRDRLGPGPPDRVGGRRASRHRFPRRGGVLRGLARTCSMRTAPASATCVWSRPTPRGAGAPAARGFRRRAVGVLPGPLAQEEAHEASTGRARVRAHRAQALRPGGTLRLATDWQDYADQMRTVLDAAPAFERAFAGEWAERFEGRVLTAFERKGIRSVVTSATSPTPAPRHDLPRRRTRARPPDVDARARAGGAGVPGRARAVRRPGRVARLDRAGDRRGIRDTGRPPRGDSDPSGAALDTGAESHPRRLPRRARSVRREPHPLHASWTTPRSCDSPSDWAGPSSCPTSSRGSSSGIERSVPLAGRWTVGVVAVAWLAGVIVLGWLILPFLLRDLGRLHELARRGHPELIGRLFVGVGAVGIWDELFFVCTVFVLLRRHFPDLTANALQAIVSSRSCGSSAIRRGGRC